MGHSIYEKRTHRTYVELLLGAKSIADAAASDTEGESSMRFGEDAIVVVAMAVGHMLGKACGWKTEATRVGYSG